LQLIVFDSPICFFLNVLETPYGTVAAWVGLLEKMLHCWVRLLLSFYLWDALSFRVFVGTGIWHDGVVISLISSLLFFSVSFVSVRGAP